MDKQCTFSELWHVDSSKPAITLESPLHITWSFQPASTSHMIWVISQTPYILSHISYLISDDNCQPAPMEMRRYWAKDGWCATVWYCLNSRLDFHSGGYMLCCDLKGYLCYDLKSYFGKGPIDSFRWSLPSSAVFSSAHNEKKAYLFLNWYRFWCAALFLWSQEPSAPPC